MGQLKECKSRNGCYEHLELCYVVSRNKENIHGVRTAVACLRKKNTSFQFLHNERGCFDR